MSKLLNLDRRGFGQRSGANSFEAKQEPNSSFRPGESPIEYAVSIGFDDGSRHIPQHFLVFHHTRETVEEIVCDIAYSDRYLLFVSEDQGSIYIQIGIIGVENYPSIDGQNGPKIVYGRCWRVEPNLPTSEIIQTALLAIKKAKEHELRELFRLRRGTALTTPLNGHLDTPLLVQRAETLRANTTDEQSIEALQRFLDNVRFNEATIGIKNIHPHNSELWIVDVTIGTQATDDFPEIGNKTYTILLDRLTSNEIYFQLLDMLVHLSNCHVDEGFTYQRFKRFSRGNSVEAIADISTKIRKLPKNAEMSGLARNLVVQNLETDATRVPNVYKGLLRKKLRSSLEKFPNLSGLKPDL